MDPPGEYVSHMRRNVIAVVGYDFEEVDMEHAMAHFKHSLLPQSIRQAMLILQAPIIKALQNLVLLYKGPYMICFVSTLNPKPSSPKP